LPLDQIPSRNFLSDEYLIKPEFMEDR
jgi:hypothetical protein